MPPGYWQLPKATLVGVGEVAADGVGADASAASGGDVGAAVPPIVAAAAGRGPAAEGVTISRCAVMGEFTVDSRMLAR
jgi:hypothetical protein